MNTNTYVSIQQFAELVQLQDYGSITQEHYVWQVRKLAEHLGADPATVQEDQLRQYFLFLREEKHWQASAMTQARVALRLFFRQCLKVGQDWTVFEDLRIARPEPLPLVLSREEVAAVLGCVEQVRYRTCLRLIYHCGLRIGEAVSLAPRDIHGKEDSPYLHLHNPKGGKDRYVPIALGMVEELRQWWRTYRHPYWLFPAQPKVVPGTACALNHMGVDTLQQVFAWARQQSAIHPQATVHTLR